MFKRRQGRLAHKLIDLALFRNRAFSAGVAAALVSMVALIGFQLVLSQRLQLVLGLSPLEAGLSILPIPLAAFVTGPIAGVLLPRLGAINALWSSLFLVGAGLALSGLTYDAPLLWQVPGLVILGCGVGATMTAASSTIMTSAPADRAGMAASIEEVSFELGGAIGVAILGSVLTAAYGASLVVPAGVSVQPTIFDSLDEALVAVATLPEAAADALRLAAFAAFDRAFIAVVVVAAVLSLATALAIWLVRQKAKASPASP